MPKIRTVLLDGIAFAASCAGLFVAADGYARDLTPAQRAAAQVWFDPETTTSIIPKDEKATAGQRGRNARSGKSVEATAEPSKGWVDPTYRKRAW